MATISSVDATVGVGETFRAQDGGCLGYLVVDEASRAAWAIDPRLDQVEELVDTRDRTRAAPDPCGGHAHPRGSLVGGRPAGPEDRRDRARPCGFKAQARRAAHPRG